MRMITKSAAVALLLLVGTACAAGGSGPDLGAVAPCELLTPAQRADAGLGSGRPADTGPVRSCTWAPAGAGFGVPTSLLVLPDTELDEARAFSPGADPGDRGDLTTTVDVGSGLLSLAGTDCGRQQETVESMLANLPA